MKLGAQLNTSSLSGLRLLTTKPCCVLNVPAAELCCDSSCQSVSLMFLFQCNRCSFTLHVTTWSINWKESQRALLFFFPKGKENNKKKKKKTFLGFSKAAFHWNVQQENLLYKCWEQIARSEGTGFKFAPLNDSWFNLKKKKNLEFFSAQLSC